MKLAMVFPGQGAGIEREAAAWCECSAPVRRLVDVAARHTGVSAGDLLASIGWATMSTERLEPLLTAICLGIHEELVRRGVRADVVAGHSLGEIPACAAIGCCTPEEAVALAAERGRLMAREAARRPGGMVVVTAASRKIVEEAVAFAGSGGIVAIAAHNTPNQWVISGEWTALRRLATRRPATPVAVTGAWHSDILADVVETFRTAARRTLTQPIRTPFIANRTGAFVGSVEDLPDLLAEQLTHPVEWVRVMETLSAFGVTEVVTVGPARILRGLIRFNLGRHVALHSTEVIGDPERIAEACVE